MDHQPSSRRLGKIFILESAYGVISRSSSPRGTNDSEMRSAHLSFCVADASVTSANGCSERSTAAATIQLQVNCDIRRQRTSLTCVCQALKKRGRWLKKRRASQQMTEPSAEQSSRSAQQITETLFVGWDAASFVGELLLARASVLLLAAPLLSFARSILRALPLPASPRS